jgi:putative FmdB family regulatory protein
MPLHRHECDSCGNTFRVLVLPGADDETPTCPKCGSRSTHRLMPLVAVQFKGTGYYKTDYGRRGRRAAKESEGAGSSDSAEKKSASAASSDDSGA